MASKQGDGSDGSPYAGKIMELGELKDLLARFGMMVGLDTSPEADTDIQVAQMAHALVGVVEAHATRAEEAYRAAGAQPGDIIQASLMAFAGVNCQSEVDELALIHWRATRLAGVLGALDFPGPFPRQGHIGSGDALIRTIRLFAAALSGMTSAAHAAANPWRADTDAALAGHALSEAMDALEEAAKDIPTHRSMGDLMRLTD
ncbi:MAG: hypothetical protein QOD57_3289 [Actinomycetota bacterium]|jgi:hypothetical protein|nr:hypothetical protein [Actinomycetota bacterium]MDQ1500625.1 hypothetical protein [Actinomycetota bacterium]MDQ1505562.1 hypothetical protein [Actinomycetota bacterium]MDQ1565669.1 hypothetical protein [Actinomycetota bacterium]